MPICQKICQFVKILKNISSLNSLSRSGIILMPVMSKSSFSFLSSLISSRHVPPAVNIRTNEFIKTDGLKPLLLLEEARYLSDSSVKQIA